MGDDIARIGVDDSEVIEALKSLDTKTIETMLLDPRITEKAKLRIVELVGERMRCSLLELLKFFNLSEPVQMKIVDTMAAKEEFALLRVVVQASYASRPDLTEEQAKKLEETIFLTGVTMGPNAILEGAIPRKVVEKALAYLIQVGRASDILLIAQVPMSRENGNAVVRGFDKALDKLLADGDQESIESVAVDMLQSESWRSISASLKMKVRSRIPQVIKLIEMNGGFKRFRLMEKDEQTLKRLMQNPLERGGLELEGHAMLQPPKSKSNARIIPIRTNRK